MTADVTLELAPYGFPIRVELRDGQARVFVREVEAGEGWEDAGVARVVSPPPLRSVRPAGNRLRQAG